MITITRNLARQLRSMLRRALKATGPRGAPPVSIATGPEGLIVKAMSERCAVEYRELGNLPVKEIVLPLSALADFAGRGEQPVTLECRGEGQVYVAWQDTGVPQAAQYDSPETAVKRRWPKPPAELADNGPELLSALQDAVDTTDPESTRWAVDCLQLCGEAGRIIATDGRQLLVQDGFTFPWNGNVLVPANKALAAKELRSDIVRIGKSDNWLTLVLDRWTLHLALNKSGRFPEAESHLPATKDAKSTLPLSEADAKFLAQSLKRLPGGGDTNQPLTIDLNGQAVIRAQGENDPAPTELLLSGSPAAGKDVRINTSRAYLGRALQLGFRTLHVCRPDSPVLCQDARRKYVWALLTAEDAIKPADNAVRVESSAGDEQPASAARPPASRSVHQSNNTQRKEQPTAMPAKRTTRAAKPAANGQPDNGVACETQGHDDLITQAAALRGALRDAVQRTSELVAALKHERRQSRAIRSTLASLRQLQTLDV